MTSDDVLEKVKEIFEKDDSSLDIDRISIFQKTVRTGPLFSKKIEKKVWHVMTNYGWIGGNDIFEFDDETGMLLKHVFWPK